MGTRGIYIFYYKGNYYSFYNNMDSYPEGLGLCLVKMLLTNDTTKFGKMLEDIFINNNIIVTRLYNNFNKYEVDYEYNSNPDDIRANEIDFDIEANEVYFLNSKIEYTDKYRNEIKYKYIKWTPLLLDFTLYFLYNKICPNFIDSELTEITQKFELDPYREWTYLIDLDYNLFSIYTGDNEFVSDTYNNEKINYTKIPFNKLHIYDIFKRKMH